MADLGRIEYRVRLVGRYVITRYHVGADGSAPLSETKGEYNNAQVAHEVAYALCKAEHERLGLPVGDERIQYPQPVSLNSAEPAEQMA